MFKKDIKTNTLALHRDLNLLIVKDLIDHTILLTVYKQRDTNTNLLSNQFFYQNQNIHQHNTRQLNKLHIKRYETKQGHSTISYKG